MSCTYTELAKEHAGDLFWKCLEVYDFQALVFESFLSYSQQWQEKEYGFREDPYENAFETLWAYDAIGMFHNPLEVIFHYNKQKGEL